MTALLVLLLGAVSLALLVLSGRSIEQGLLDVAAVFALAGTWVLLRIVRAVPVRQLVQPRDLHARIDRHPRNPAIGLLSVDRTVDDAWTGEQVVEGVGGGAAHEGPGAQARAARRPFTKAGTLAKRFAAKEAFSKAVGTGFKRGVFMKDIGVANLPSGAPTLELAGGAKAALDALIPAGHSARIHLSLTDDHPWAQAFVIIEAIPASGVIIEALPAVAERARRAQEATRKVS